MRLRLLVLMGVGALAVLLSACSGDGADAHVGIGMQDNFFTREVTRVAPGDTVRFDNTGATFHNAFAVNGEWASNEIIEPGEHQDIVFDEPGIYHFYCTFHATVEEGSDQGIGMVATLVVGDLEFQAGSDDGAVIEPVHDWSGVTRNVPADHPTIQNAVDAAEPGDLVLIDEGVYFEQVNVTTPYITIRGVDRQGVIIDGEFTRPNGINIVAADGVAVENLTTRNATQNGVFWTGLSGYRSSYVTAVNNGVYGIYSFDATDGVFEHSYASSSPDAGFYIGQCDPCRAVITDSLAEWNGLGFSGTNASGELYLVNSEWSENIGGVVPNTLDTELLPPFHDVSVVGNYVHHNGNADAPTLPNEWYAYGVGIVLAGGNDSLVERNLMVANNTAGVAVAPNYSKNFWMTTGNTVRNNVIEHSGQADILYAGPSQGNDRFCNNDVDVTVPPALEVFAGCDGLRLPMGYNLGTTMEVIGRAVEAERRSFPHGDDPDYWQTTPNPRAADQPDMPGGADAPVTHAADAFAKHDPNLPDNPDLFLASFEVPAMAGDLDTSTDGSFNVFGVNLIGSPWTVIFGLYAYLLPFVLYAAWVAIALWDLARREDLGKGKTLGWIAAILLIPFLGVIGYHIGGKSELPGWLRGAIVGGGLASYLIILAIGAVLGGIV